jgi:hypothetical protein
MTRMRIDGVLLGYTEIETAGPSAPLGMTRGEWIFPLDWLRDEPHCRSLGFPGFPVEICGFGQLRVVLLGRTT